MITLEITLHVEIVIILLLMFDSKDMLLVNVYFSNTFNRHFLYQKTSLSGISEFQYCKYLFFFLENTHLSNQILTNLGPSQSGFCMLFVFNSNFKKAIEPNAMHLLK